jgi:hypothetical protein
MLRAWHAVAALAVASPALAAPVWETAETIEGLAVYRDHAESNRFYYAPSGYRIAESGGAPQVYFRVFRYLGTPETGDTGEIRIAGLLSIDAEQATVAERYVPALATLKRRNAHATLRPLPVDAFRANLNYLVIGGDDQSGSIDAAASGYTADGGESDVGADAGEPDSVESVSGPAYWTRRRFTVALDPLTAEVFWANFENDALQLSLTHQLTSAGMRRNAAGAWERDERAFADSVGVHISMQEQPSHFAKIETWALAKRRRTDVMVMCYDYTARDDDELFRVTVDLRFKTLRNQDYVETVRFDPGQETEKTISFRLARNLEEPYYYRVTRLFHTLPMQRSEWIEHRGMLLEVTDFAM